jgi:hypothetical protein
MITVDALKPVVKARRGARRRVRTGARSSRRSLAAWLSATRAARQP